MRYIDKVYGKAEIQDPVILELLQSKPLERIKHINQAGSFLVLPYKTVTRFDHCVGTMLLLKKYGASLEEQVAGLLHDVPHTAFSHVADFVFQSRESQSYHEHFLRKIVLNSEIPAILKKYNIDPEKVTDESNFPLLEQNIPALCADRIDYSLRDMKEEKRLSDQDIEEILSSISITNGVFVMTDSKIAKKYAENFMNQCRQSWAEPRQLAIFEIIASAIKLGLQEKDITEADLFTTDEKVLQKLQKSDNEEIQKYLSYLTPELKIKTNEANFDYDTHGKARYVDPLVLQNGKVKKLSKIYPDFAESIPKFLDETRKGYKIEILK